MLLTLGHGSGNLELCKRTYHRLKSMNTQRSNQNSIPSFGVILSKM